ncbi:LLM class flavin-dependent oxidoreductase [Pseudonocardia asaccharolytica]|uniref:N5,N10-methylene tetrahydromethanopterin reductase n=1 Tax=Pseudonocardia asaccharolytica DSM 44247 = NBRC 16224 TaxID=1123024 RepID=A0A511D107_9PSEU|nr:LLM class flavin-dependent oxidoreductase [Pseudonocardia asaccharolytica]GEL16568.1 N5,N10-methylene tetrahydromethanopterin reductase [Pseudonocardia asaccharolytica DSM 44247 = NBRC 16224]
MANDHRLGILLISTTPPERLPELARLCEELGFDEIWLAEDYFFYGGFTGVGQALAATERIRVGLGVVSCVARHPAVAAMEIASLGRAFPGRFLSGIGHGVPAWVQQMGLAPRSPMRALEEAVTAIRTLLTTREPQTSEGTYFTLRDVALFHPPLANVPLYLGVIGEKGCELAGRIADGNVLSVLAPTEYVSWARSLGLRGMSQAGRSGSFSVPTFVLTAVDHDRARARTAVRQSLAFYLNAVGPTPLTGVIGINDMVAELIAAGGYEALLDGMPDDWVDVLAISGTPDEAAARIEQYWAAGADSVILSPQPAESAESQLKLIAGDVLPRLNR